MKVELGKSILFCFVGPSGSGKSSLCSRLVAQDANLNVSISATSRQPRQNEKNGEHYHFFSKEQFQELITKDAVFEWEQVHGNYYGTLKETLSKASQKGQDLLLDVDIKGALNFQRNFPANTVLIFVLPPSLEELITRVTQRSNESDEVILQRLKTASQELALFERNYATFDYFLVNDNLQESLKTAGAIVVAERFAIDRQYYEVSLSIKNFISSLNQRISGK